MKFIEKVQKQGDVWFKVLSKARLSGYDYGLKETLEFFEKELKPLGYNIEDIDISVEIEYNYSDETPVLYLEGQRKLEGEELEIAKKELEETEEERQRKIEEGERKQYEALKKKFG